MISAKKRTSCVLLQPGARAHIVAAPPWRLILIIASHDIYDFALSQRPAYMPIADLLGLGQEKAMPDAERRIY